MTTRRVFVVLSLWLATGFCLTFATTLEEDFRLRSGWSLDLLGAMIKDQHAYWHTIHFDGVYQGREFLEFHREFLAQSDDFRLYGMDSPAGGDIDPDPAAIPVVPLPRSALRFEHSAYDLSGNILCARPANHRIDDAVHPHTCGAYDSPLSSWTTRPGNMLLGSVRFDTYSVNELGSDIQLFLHNDNHIAVAKHRPIDMMSMGSATKDGAFYQWHKEIDNIYADWAVGQYQYQFVNGLLTKSGRPIFFSVSASAVGRADTQNALRDRSQGQVYRGLNPPASNQYGAIPRIGSDIYVGDQDNKNLLYAAGINTGSPSGQPWDIDAWTILNPSGNGWYFSVTMSSAGLAGTAVANPINAPKGGDVFDSTAGGTNSLCRSETSLGLAATDELDALEIDRERRVQGTNEGPTIELTPVAGVYDRPKQWFSLRSATGPMVQAFIGNVAANVTRQVTPNDILRFDENGYLKIDLDGGAGGLGLVADGTPPDDDLDALVIVDVAPLDEFGAGDIVYYSLAKGSPSLVAGGKADSAADILCYTVGVGACAKVPAATIGLVAAPGMATDDDLDALDVRKGACGGGGGGAALVARTSTCALDPGCFISDIMDPPTTLVVSGACCRTDGTCTNSTLDTDCASAGGFFGGQGTTCVSGLCPSPGGACCRTDGTCTDNTLKSVCLSAGGSFAGMETVCASAQCPSALGACCHSNGSCTLETDRNCLDLPGTFRGPGTTCPPVPACPAAPANDECATAFVIPYNFVSGYAPPADNTNATSPAYFLARDPPYSCYDREVFSGPYGRGTIWYSYTVPAGTAPGRSIFISTERAAQHYPFGDGAGDTRIGLYYAPNNDCSVLQEVACADNIPCGGDIVDAAPLMLYAPLRYDDPQPGRYYIQVSTVSNVDRGHLYLTISDPNMKVGDSDRPKKRGR